MIWEKERYYHSLAKKEENHDAKVLCVGQKQMSLRVMSSPSLRPAIPMIIFQIKNSSQAQNRPNVCGGGGYVCTLKNVLDKCLDHKRPVT